MVTGSQRRYDEAHPKFTLRLNPEIKDRIRRVGDENDKTMSEVAEDFIINGLNGTNDVEKPGSISTTNDGTAKYNALLDKVDGMMDDALSDGFSEGYNQCKVELKDKINGKLNGFKTDEFEYSCPCGFEFNEKSAFCPDCGKELEWDDVDDGAGSTDKGMLENIMDSINDLFSDITGGDRDVSENDNSKSIDPIGGNKSTPTDKKEYDWECDGCGAEFDGNPKVCPKCGLKFDYDDSGAGLLDGLKKWNDGG